MGFQYSASASCLTLPYHNLDLPSQICPDRSDLPVLVCVSFFPRIWVEMASYSVMLVARIVSTLEVALLKLSYCSYA